MEKMIIIAIAFVLLIVIMIRSIKGSNFTLIAKNVAGIYEAVNNCAYSAELNETQKYFLTIVFDMMPYVKRKVIELDEIESMAKIVKLDSGNDALENVSRLAKEVIWKVYILQGKADRNAIEVAIDKNENNICKAVKKELDAKSDGKICRKWIPLVEQIVVNKSFEDNIERLKAIP